MFIVAEMDKEGFAVCIRVTWEMRPCWDVLIPKFRMPPLPTSGTRVKKRYFVKCVPVMRL